MDEFIKFNNQTSGRDKLFRLVQYTSRVVWYSLEKRSSSPDAIKKAKDLDQILGLMRRLLRFGRFYESVHTTFPAFSIPDGTIRFTTAMSRISNACFMFIDHVVCMDKLGLLPPKLIDSSKWDLVSTRFWLYAILLGLIRDVYDIMRIYKEEFRVKFRSLRAKEKNMIEASTSTSQAKLSYRNQASSSNSVVRYLNQAKAVSRCIHDHADVAVDTVKNLLDLFIPLNTLGYLKLSPGTIGALGAISTIVSAIPQLNPMVKMVPSG